MAQANDQGGYGNICGGCINFKQDGTIEHKPMFNLAEVPVSPII